MNLTNKGIQAVTFQFLKGKVQLYDLAGNVTEWTQEKNVSIPER